MSSWYFTFFHIHAYSQHLGYLLIPNLGNADKPGAKRSRRQRAICRRRRPQTCRWSHPSPRFHDSASAPKGSWRGTRSQDTGFSRYEKKVLFTNSQKWPEKRANAMIQNNRLPRARSNLHHHERRDQRPRESLNPHAPLNFFFLAGYLK